MKVWPLASLPEHGCMALLSQSFKIGDYYGFLTWGNVKPGERMKKTVWLPQCLTFT